MDKCAVREFGTCADGRPVMEFTLTDGAGNRAVLINYGAVLRSLWIGDRDVVLGYDTVAEYEGANSCFGSTMGRCAGRVAGSRITLSGVTYRLSENRAGFQIHGGFQGFHKKLWDYTLADGGVRFTYVSEDGEEGYPGRVTASVTYRWAEDGVLELSYDCVSDRETVINLTNHSYFNLNGQGDILDHKLQVFSDKVAAVDGKGIPTGEFYSTGGTPLDFSEPTAIGSRIGEDFPALRQVGGYDHNYILSGGFRPAAKLWGRDLSMTVLTDSPDLGLYTANFLAEQPGKDGAAYGPFHGVCLETQFLPNGANLPEFEPKPVFRAGEHFRFTTQFSFS